MTDDCPAPSGPRTLHPLALPGRLFDPGPVARLRGRYVDCETTGTVPEYDDMIELAKHSVSARSQQSAVATTPMRPPRSRAASWLLRS